MHLDNTYLSNDKGISFIKNEMQKKFGVNIDLMAENINLNHHGWFLLQYLYKPKNHTITFESEFNSFDISIANDEGGYISLMRLSDCNTSLITENVKIAIEELNEVLQQEISFYKSINDKQVYIALFDIPIKSGIIGFHTQSLAPVFGLNTHIYHGSGDVITELEQNANVKKAMQSLLISSSQVIPHMELTNNVEFYNSDYIRAYFKTSVTYC